MTFVANPNKLWWNRDLLNWNWFLQRKIDVCTEILSSMLRNRLLRLEIVFYDDRSSFWVYKNDFYNENGVHDEKSILMTRKSEFLHRKMCFMTRNVDKVSAKYENNNWIVEIRV